MRDKVVVITGAASGIGRATAERLAGEGARLVLADRDDSGELARRLGGGALAVVLDVADELQVADLVARATAQFGAIDVLVNAAGINQRGLITESSVADFERILATNLRGTFLGCRAVIPVMRAGGGGAIVNLGSELAFVAGRRLAAYSASKAAVVQLTRCLAVDHWADRIRVNCVCPGPVRTALLERGFAEADDPAASRAATAASTIMGRLGEPSEIAAAIRFLASADASFMTGAVMMVDGGVTAGAP